MIENIIDNQGNPVDFEQIRQIYINTLVDENSDFDASEPAILMLVNIVNSLKAGTFKIRDVRDGVRDYLPSDALDVMNLIWSEMHRYIGLARSMCIWTQILTRIPDFIMDEDAIKIAGENTYAAEILEDNTSFRNICDGHANSNDLTEISDQLYDMFNAATIGEHLSILYKHIIPKPQIDMRISAAQRADLLHDLLKIPATCEYEIARSATDFGYFPSFFKIAEQSTIDSEVAIAFLSADKRFYAMALQRNLALLNQPTPDGSTVGLELQRCAEEDRWGDFWIPETVRKLRHKTGDKKPL